MILERYRKRLPPYWYENEVADYHFEAAFFAADTHRALREDMEQQFFPLSATWGLDVWDWIYFGKKQSLSLVERRKSIQQKHWAYLGFTPSVLRAIGNSSSQLKNVQMVEDFSQKMIRYVYPLDDLFDIKGAVEAFEKIRPVHVNGVAFEPVVAETIEIRDVLAIGIREYHNVYEFRVGMTPIKRSEVILA